MNNSTLYGKHKIKKFLNLECFLLQFGWSDIFSMKPTFFLRRTASAASVVVLLSIVVLGGWTLAPEVHSQAPTAATVPTAALLPLITKLKAQQAQIAANQTKIEAQTALLKENLRQAKIFSARSGSGHR